MPSFGARFRCRVSVPSFDEDYITHARQITNRVCKSRGLVFILKTSGALRLSLRYFNIEIPIQKVKFVFEDVVDEQFAELSKKNY